MARANSGMGTGTPQGSSSAFSDDSAASRPEERVIPGPEGLERAPSGHGAGYKDPQATKPPAPVKGAHGAGDETSARTADTSREKEDGAPEDKSATPEQVLGNIAAEQQAQADRDAAAQASRNS